MKKKTLLFLWILVFVQIVSAEFVVKTSSDPFVIDVFQPVTDFILYGENTISMCSCEVSAHVLTVENTGNIRTEYILATESNYAQIYPTTFSLDPGESKDITNILNIPCMLDDGFDVIISIETNSGLERSFKQDILVSRCENLVAKPLITQRTITPCELTNMSIGISNTGPFSEIYSFELLNFSGDVYLVDQATVPPGTTSILNLALQPDCAVSGYVAPVLNIKTKNTGLQADVPLYLQILPRYNYTLEVEEDIAICKDVETEIPVTILNKANLTNQYDISVEGQDWFRMSDNQMNLTRQSSGGTSLELNPSQTGNYVAAITVDPLYGDKKVLDTYIEVIDCYDYEVYLLSDQVCEDDSEIFVSLTNNGIYDQSFSLELDAPSFAELEENSIEVDTSENEKIAIKLHDPEPGEYIVKVNTNIDGLDFPKGAGVNLEVVPVGECYDVEILDSKLWFSHDWEYRSFVLQNKGIKGATYVIEPTTQEGWLILNKTEFYLASGEKRSVPVILYANETKKQGKYPVNFKIYAQEPDIMYTDSVDFTLLDYNVFGFLAAFRCPIIMIFLILAAFIFFIFSIKNYDDKKRYYQNIVVLLVVLILILCSLTLCFGFYRKAFDLEYEEIVDPAVNICPYNESICSSAQYISWNEDSGRAVDLGRYFNDPDGDLLNYSMTETDNISVSFRDNQARFTPKRDWYGSAEVTITADDRKGGIISSELYLQVLNTREFSFNDFFLDYYGYVFMCIALILLIILVLFVNEYRKS